MNLTIAKELFLSLSLGIAVVLAVTLTIATVIPS